MRIAYTLLLYLLLPIVLLRLAWRARRQRGYLAHVGERFGFYPQRADAPLIWVHAVSVGETRAAEPLIEALRARYPQHRILLTHMTPTGRETGQALFGENVSRCYLPYDYPGAVARFLAHFRPQAGILMETEIWPNLIRACSARGVALYLVNARLSEKSFARYRRAPGFARASFGGLAAVAAQTADDAQRLVALGARDARVTGSIKFDVTSPPAQVEAGHALRRRFGDARPVLLAASTRDGEEALLIEQLPRVDVPGLLTVIVPRHPQRFEEVARMVQRSGLRLQRRSANEAIAPETQIVLGDSMGEMFAYYTACDVAFIGGSLLPFGGQNLIEACAAGKPVLIGPSTYNFAEAAELAVGAGAAIQVPDAAALAREAGRLLRDPDAARRMGQAGLAFCGVHRGATARVLELIRL
ncbi:MAG: 3-deoxy-D-manno-octulosonic acid transferase [Betaproteobacteria bacterium RIFCSPLOWO2_02_FULL_67_26]|nr:MAG: 3-deoxy-D-manno-octulosonic acid transferase [Betaproteobacteria bacterium RIFCSPLOWO2_02_FULL_67_26]